MRDPFVVRHKQRNPAVEDRDLDIVVGEDQFQVVVFDRTTSSFITVNAAEVEQVFLVD